MWEFTFGPKVFVESKKNKNKSKYESAGVVQFASA